MRDMSNLDLRAELRPAGATRETLQPAFKDLLGKITFGGVGNDSDHAFA